MTRTFWRLLAAPLVMALVLLTPIPAIAQTYGPGPTVSCTVDRSITTRGGTVTVTCVGFLEGETGTVTFESAPVVVGTAVADANGTLSLTFEVPENADLGGHDIVVTGGTSGRVGSVGITVVALEVEGVPAPRGLAFTGTNVAFGTAAGAGIIGIGGMLVLASRKRRRRSVGA